MTSREAGYTFAELLVATIIIGILVLLMMPALGGYNTNAAVRTTASQAVSDLREAQELAISENMVVNVAFHPSDQGRATQGWTMSNSGAVTMFTRSVPAQVNFVATCYRGWFTPQGSWAWVTNVCGNPPATVELLCFDSGTPANPLALEVIIVIATGDMTVQQKPAGACP